MQMVSAVCQFRSVQSAVEATVAVKQSSIPVARIGLYTHVTFLLLDVINSNQSLLKFFSQITGDYNAITVVRVRRIKYILNTIQYNEKFALKN